ncbi:MAG: Signal transduction histidine-protein kinase AtoS [Luteibacter sp.]|uniref:sensor histidine kinase n=1 Tax=Luteibacter sp. TaxID=1886636 RepID=UPI00137E9752|nr:ATP-binding protein [Luteibacter sp.]KAF1006309.1 MAG: Signal transduction histidine-protein kinase AtoS [Luteibacter sp.]
MTTPSEVPSASVAHPRLLRRRAMVWAFWYTLPLALVAVVLVCRNDLPLSARLMLLLAGALGSGLVGRFLGRRLLASVGTAFDLLASLREGDYGLRGHVQWRRDPLQALIADINALSDELRDGRRKRTEASRFLGKTLVALNSAVFVVDDTGVLRLINPAARRLLHAERTAVVGRAADQLGLGPALAARDDSILDHHFPSGRGRWVVRRAVWYSAGREHVLVMLHDMSAALSEEERRAWQRLIRVLSYELNNSLTPIGSLAGSLAVLLDKESPETARQTVKDGLDAIERRAAGLARFLAGYGRLARLPPLQRTRFRLDESLARLVRLESRLVVEMVGQRSAVVDGDEDQLGQAFVNLLRNAVESALARDSEGRVWLDWRIEIEHVVVTIEDEGVGLPASDCLFVPFFTTKPDGAGIGLSLSRLIVEAHGGSVELRSRDAGPGALAVVRLPFGIPT